MEGVAEELICGTRGAMGRREALARLGHAGLRWATVALYWAVEGAGGRILHYVQQTGHGRAGLVLHLIDAVRLGRGCP